MRVPLANRSLLALGAAALALVLAACGSSSPATTSSTLASATQTGDTVHVVMKSLAFSPTLVRAAVGQKVLWSNIDNAPHNVTYVSGPPFVSSKTLNPGHSFEITVNTPGTIHYVCTIHPWMKATVVVTP